MKIGYFSIGKRATQELLINKSRFIGDVFHVVSEDEALENIQSIRDTYPDATHHCYAYYIGVDSIIKRFNDDGEPSGTAGMPILQVIEQREIENVLVVVTRYFGGIKLGAGGLVRAYSKTTAKTLDKAGRVWMELCDKGILTIEYEYLGSVEYFLNQNNIPILDTIYEDKVYIYVISPQPWDELVQRVNDICNGTLIHKKLGQEYYPLAKE
ncbi:MAG TPA: YigZ family protein [Clostridiales bacterium]|nr:YigZ family protein [Clostridiales bacterium]